MKKKLSKIFSVVVAVSCITTTVSAAFSSVGIDYSKDMPIDGINSWTATAVLGASDPADSTNTVVKLNGEGSLSKTFADITGAAFVSMDMYMESLNANDLTLSIKNTDTEIVSVKLNNGTTAFGENTYADAYTANAWFSVGILVDGDTAELYVDRIKVGETALPESVSFVNKIEITGNDTVYFDNFKAASQNETLVDSTDASDWATTKINDVFADYTEDAGTVIAGQANTTGTYAREHNWVVATQKDNYRNAIYAQLYADNQQSSNFAYTDGSKSESVSPDKKYLMIRNQSYSSVDTNRRVYKTIMTEDGSAFAQFAGKAIYKVKLNVFTGANKYYLDLRSVKNETVSSPMTSDPGRQAARIVFDYTADGQVDNGAGGTVYAEYDTSTTTTASLETVDLGTFIPGAKTSYTIDKAWMDVAIVADTNTRTYDVYINGEKKNTEKIPFYYDANRMNGTTPVTATEISYISFEVAGKKSSVGGRLYVESVGMYTDQKLLYDNFTDVSSDDFESLKEIPVYESIAVTNDNGQVKLTVTKTTEAIETENVKAYVCEFDNTELKQVEVIDISDMSGAINNTKEFTASAITDVSGTLKAFVWNTSLIPLTSVIK